MSSSESSLSPSSSPPQSPRASYHGPPTLGRLVTHFVAAKRSLNSTSHIYRANEIVTNSRALVEEIAVLNAKNAFGRRGLDEQVDTLHTIRDAVVEDGDKVSEEFQLTLSELDKAHVRLEKTLKTLRKTVVTANSGHVDESKESHSETTASSEGDDGDQKTLYEFIDDATHEDLLQSLRNLIDSYHHSKANLDTNLHTLSASLTTITGKLFENLDSDFSSPHDKPTIYDEPRPTVAQLFHDMESHATQMASLLSNLVDHHDKCVEALKHTEGGGEAAALAIQSTDLTKGPEIEQSLYGKTAAEPISEEERQEMLNVVEDDAPQVEDVVLEMRDYANEMESYFTSLTSHARQARKTNKRLRSVIERMRLVRTEIPSYIEAAASFRKIWKTINVEMRDKTKEVCVLSIFYEQFLSGYAKLLREVERRKGIEAQMRKVAEKARRELERLYDADGVARQEFMEEVSQFIPSDLGAWHGLEEEATRWEIRVADGEGMGLHEETRLHDG